MENILRLAKEELKQKYDLEARGYDFGRVAERVAEVISMEIEKVMACGKAPQTVKAQAILSFWAHRKLGMTTIEIARENRFELIVRNA